MTGLSHYLRHSLTCLYNCMCVFTIRCRNVLSDALTANTHQNKFQLLLQLEEIQMEVDIRKYDLFGIQLGQYKDNRRLLTLEVGLLSLLKRLLVLLVLRSRS